MTYLSTSSPEVNETHSRILSSSLKTSTDVAPPHLRANVGGIRTCLPLQVDKVDGMVVKTD